jgi:hypothetical protein
MAPAWLAQLGSVRAKKKEKIDEAVLGSSSSTRNTARNSSTARRRAWRRSSTRKAREAPASFSPAEELLLFHLVQTAARRRPGNTGNVWASWSSASSGELEPGSYFEGDDV